MKILNFKISIGMLSKEFIFGQKTLIFSTDNSVGKTSLLRMLLFSLGYPIPSTRGLNFGEYNYETKIETDSKNLIDISRYGDYIEISTEGTKSYFTLPDDLDKVLELIFEIRNYDVLRNLLGAFYIDQEKGWTLLNRGKAIGKISFNIEELILGLAGKDFSFLKNKLYDINNEEKKYQLIQDAEVYKKEVLNRYGPLTPDLEIDYEESRLQSLKLERKSIQNEINNIDFVIRKNRTFEEFVETMRIEVENEEGVRIPVNKRTIVEFGDYFRFLAEKKRMLSQEKAKFDSQISQAEQKFDSQRLFPEGINISDRFAFELLNIEINQEQVYRSLAQLQREKRQVQANLRNLTKSSNDVMNFLHQTIYGYAIEMGVDSKYVPTNKDYILTSDLKSLSGVILHKLVFSFRLGYIAAVSKFQDVKLPIIIDSPKAKEIKDKDINNMLYLLERDFSEHQVIIASIFKYDINFSDTIIIEDYLLDDKMIFFPSTE